MTFRGTLIALTVVLLLALAAVGARWAYLNFTPSPRPLAIPEDAPIQHVGYEAIAERAVRSFAALPEDRRAAVLENLENALGSVASGLTRMVRAGPNFLCIGEYHAGSTRRFLAEQVFATLPLDVLYLEIPQEDLPDLLARIDAGDEAVLLLGADIAAIVRAVRTRNPHVVISGIDESAAQREERELSKRGSRDLSITTNFRSRFRKGKRHAALFGSLHCAEQPNWMYVRIRDAETRMEPGRTWNLNVMGAHQDGALEAFLVFLSEIGIRRDAFMIADTSALDPNVYRWFSPLTRSFRRFRSVIVFPEGAGSPT